MKFFSENLNFSKMRERLKLIRKELGMTQEMLAQKLGIGKSALSILHMENILQTEECVAK